MTQYADVSGSIPVYSSSMKSQVPGRTHKTQKKKKKLDLREEVVWELPIILRERPIILRERPIILRERPIILGETDYFKGEVKNIPAQGGNLLQR